MKFFSIHLSNEKWTRANPAAQRNIALKGQVYLDNHDIDARSLASHFGEADGAAATTALLQRLNGFYAWVEQTPTALRAGVDHIRSRPLFYGKNSNHFYLSDSAEWVRQQVGDTEMDPLAREEFQLAGYITGSDTLFPNVKQLQAGEYLEAREVDGKLQIETHRYYRFLHTEPRTFDEQALKAELDAVALRSIQRLIDYAAGRQIVVPLSGGYDSRLIVTLLKRLGYENVVTFTYGVPGNKESEYSKRVADALGLRWHFVEYSDELWREAWSSSERWTYQKWGSGWVSIPHIQDWLAVKVLKQQKVIDTDCVFAPGHSGDFVAGSHTPQRAFEEQSFSLLDALDLALEKHYSLVPLKLFSTPRDAWKRRIQNRMERHHLSEAWEYADVLDKWNWQERQAKFICNSVRVYEFFGFDWWLPLWDSNFMCYWENVPLRLRKGREFYLEYVMTIYAENSADRSARNLGNSSDFSNSIVKEFLKSIFLKLDLGKRIKKDAIKKMIGTQILYPSWVSWYVRDCNRSRNSVHPITTNGIEAHLFLKDADIMFYFDDVNRRWCTINKRLYNNGLDSEISA